MPNTSITFPSSPSLGQQYTYGTMTYVYDGTSWSVDDTIVAGPLKIDSVNSRVGINTTTPTVSLDVVGALKASGATTLSSTLGVTGATTLSSTLGVTGATTLSSTLDVTGNTTITGDLAVNGSDITTTGAGIARVFNTNALSLCLGEAATTVSIGAGTGTTTINNGLVVPLGQIKFPATQNASSDVNTLDDYEEGSMVLANNQFSFTTTPGNYTLSTTNAQKTINYTKIGNRVFYDGYVALSAITAAGTGGLLITGLPISMVGPSWFTCYFAGLAAGAATQVIGQWEGTNISFYYGATAGTSAAAIGPTLLTATSQFRFSGVGRVA